MKTLNFSFDHPVAVKVFFICESEPNEETQVKSFRSDEDGVLSIPLTGFAEGQWKVLLEWNYDGRDFCMERKVKVKPEKSKSV